MELKDWLRLDGTVEIKAFTNGKTTASRLGLIELLTKITSTYLQAI